MTRTNNDYLDDNYINDLVKRLKSEESPTDSQRLIIILSEKDNRSDDDNHKLALLIEVEQKADELADAIADAQPLIDAEKESQREADDAKRKMIWANAMETASKQDKEINALMGELKRKVYDRGYVSDKDKEAVKADYEAMVTKAISSKQSRLAKEFLNKPGNAI